MQKIYRFPTNFLWGASTAAHQIEGDCTNDWSVWEKKNAQRLAKQAIRIYRHLPKWDRLKEQAQNPANYISGKSIDGYNRYREDMNLLKDIGLNSYRFSIEWSRIEPEEGAYDEKEIQHYLEQLEYIKSKGIATVVTIWHWTIPTWLANKKGVLYPNFQKSFVAFATLLAKRLGKYVDYWITLNEPDVYTMQSYLQGFRPPRKKNFLKTLYIYFILLPNVHNETYDAIKEVLPKSKISLSKQFVGYTAIGNTFENRLIVLLAQFFTNDLFMNRVKSHLDFVGINHYFTTRINLFRVKTLLFKSALNEFKYLDPQNRIYSDFGWELYPKSLYLALKDLRKYKLPVMITEHGLADSEDIYRKWFIKDSLKYLAKAMNEGVNVIGYHHWSLLDNFEWDQGFWPQFGLIAVNRKTMERKIRKSAFTYGNIARKNTINLPEHEDEK
ncbi:MAG: Beta-glucosidase [candidate division WS6 bacterium GW2011_GWF2_39_15]|uniref:Beta-glucosidase n=1 Tax=candidate division WS6 bacterium GW2011_GWF2_39_15 TaxID=1619100 RepID=A0A0G0MSI9_9BACT|nr:MAG: Beta-glucosidase [candidate division WS6 bacterium GW2011_GWF2_39_15]